MVRKNRGAIVPIAIMDPRKASWAGRGGHPRLDVAYPYDAFHFIRMNLGKKQKRPFGIPRVIGQLIDPNNQSSVMQT
jgi:hypothetical protein